MPRQSAAKGQKPSRKEAFRQHRKAQQKRERIIIISIISVVVLIVAALIIIPNLPANIENIKKPATITRTQVDGFSSGDPNAPVKVVEYSDYKCSHCYDFWNQLEPSFEADYVNTGKVYFTYVPFSFISPESTAAAQAAYCASDQGKFWQYHDYIFANFDLSLTDPILRAVAQSVELDMTQFDQCYKSGKYLQQVTADLNSGKAKGVKSTPTFDVNGTFVDWGNLVSEVDKALAKP